MLLLQLKTASSCSGNALQWYLRKVDKASEDSTKEPSAAARAYYKASSTVLGNSAATSVGSAAQNALKLGSSLGKEAGKVSTLSVLTIQ